LLVRPAQWAIRRLPAGLIAFTVLVELVAVVLPFLLTRAVPDGRRLAALRGAGWRSGWRRPSCPGAPSGSAAFLASTRAREH